MLIDWLPEAWSLPFILLYICFLVIFMIMILRKLPPFSTKTSIESHEMLDIVIFFSAMNVFGFFLGDKRWNLKVSFGWENFVFFVYFFYQAALFGIGIYYIIRSYRKKLNKVMVSSIMLVIVSLIGLSLRLYKVLQMWNQAA